MLKEEFMEEYLNRLAFGLAQFWPADELLPDQEAEDDDTYYRVAIRRLSVFNRAELVKKMRQLCTGGFFSSCTPKEKRVKIINGVLSRFPQLQDAEHEAVVLSDRI